MKQLYIKLYRILAALSIVLPLNVCAQPLFKLSLSMVIYTLTLEAPSAQIQRLSFENELLQFENYKKGFLSSVSINMSFNRSIVKLQQATDGQYNYVEDYSSNSSAGVSVSQKIQTLSIYSSKIPPPNVIAGMTRNLIFKSLNS